MTEPIYLHVEDLLAAAVRGTGMNVEVRDYGLLESAAHRPQATVFGVEAYPSIHEKAAALLHSLARNHPLVDGNKRMSWTACALFYAMNDLSILDAPQDGAFDLVLGVASGEIDVPKIAETLAGWARPV